MRKQIFWLFGLIFIVNLSCRKSETIVSKEPPNDVIAMIGDQEVTFEELKTNFNRNSKTEEIDSTEIREFYRSYIEYRLKLYDGYEKGYHQDSTILAEFNEYASEIANRYWIENEIKSERIESFKKRFKNELKAFHILKELPEDALPVDTAEVYNELISVRDSLINGAEPEEMNENYSSRREGQPIGGQLSWITAGSTIHPFEEAVYNLKPGEISFPIRSQFGYHLILLQEIRPRTPQRMVKHIFVRKTDDGSGQEKINRAYVALEADSSWSEVLQNYTEDPSTRNRDGSLGWVGYGARFPSELIESAIQTNPGSAYSEPYEVSYGYHIMTVDSIRTFDSENQKIEFITDRLEQLGRLTPNQNDVYDRIAKESKLKIDHDNFSQLLENNSMDQTSSQLNLDLIHFFDKTYTTTDFQYWLDNISSIDEVMQSGNIIKSYRDYIIKERFVDFTRSRFPEFAQQVDTFLEGLIVFKVNEENIWNSQAVDRSELREFYKSNKNEYKKEKTFLYTEISASSDSLIQAVFNEISNGIDKNKLSERFDGLTVYDDSTSHSQNPAYSTLETLQPGEFSKPVTVNERVFIYILNEINSERILSFEEAYDRVFTDYQPIHEKNYVDQLKDRYDLQLYAKNLH